MQTRVRDLEETAGSLARDLAPGVLWSHHETELKDGCNNDATRVTRFLKEGAYPHVTREEYYELKAGSHDLTLRLLLDLLWVTGGRVSEILALRARDLQRRRSRYQLQVLRSKRRKPVREALPLPMDLALRLEDFIRLRGLGEDQRLFPLSRTTAWRKIRTLGQEVLRRRVTPHMFRHGRVYDLAREGTHPFVIAKIVGHADLQTTLGYFHPGEEDLLEAMDR